MKKKLLLTVSVLFLCMGPLQAQSQMPSSGPADSGRKMENSKGKIKKDSIETSFELTVNMMNEGKREILNRAAINYSSNTRGILADMGYSMLAGGVASIVNVVTNEIINLSQIRSKQKKAWMEMRQKECTFVDSIQSIRGQSDFYNLPSSFGPLDPTDMNFDGITLKANRRGKEVLKMVCHIDTSRISHLFLHSKFYLVVDTIVFHPYNSYLPNLKANRIERPSSDESQDEIDYWNTISQFSFSNYQRPTVNIQMDISSSWINEAAQVFQDVKLGSFSVEIPVNKNDLTDSVYVYYRSDALAGQKPVIEMNGDCFVIPRSFMPLTAENLSWGTGEYKMKVVLSEQCQYNPNDRRSKNWHRDYKQLVRMQNQGKAKNEYIMSICTTIQEEKYTILKATYAPAINLGSSYITGSSDVGGNAQTPANTGSNEPPKK